MSIEAADIPHQIWVTELTPRFASVNESHLQHMIDELLKLIERLGTGNDEVARRFFRALWEVLSAEYATRQSALLQLLLYREPRLGLLARLSWVEHRYGSQVLHEQLYRHLRAALR